MPVAITGTGLFTPPYSISNEELVTSFNAWVDAENAKNASAIERGEKRALERSSAQFISKASGIERRYAMDREGILDPQIMAPRIAERSPDEPSLQCEMAKDAASKALAQAGLTPNDIDVLLVACSNMQRPYPAISVEVQAALGTRGFAFDMNVACSSATPLYGAPAPDASADTGADASPAPLYGAVPPPDASPDASPAPLYGAVPPPDAGDDAAPDASDASPAPLYGLPPP